MNISERLYSALRSRHRLEELSTMNSPSVLIEFEKAILSKRMADLSDVEKMEMESLYEDFHQEAQQKDLIDDEIFFIRHLNEKMRRLI